MESFVRTGCQPSWKSRRHVLQTEGSPGWAPRSSTAPIRAPWNEVPWARRNRVLMQWLPSLIVVCDRQPVHRH